MLYTFYTHIPHGFNTLCNLFLARWSLDKFWPFLTGWDTGLCLSHFIILCWVLILKLFHNHMNLEFSFHSGRNVEFGTVTSITVCKSTINLCSHPIFLHFQGSSEISEWLFSLQSQQHMVLSLHQQSQTTSCLEIDSMQPPTLQPPSHTHRTWSQCT